MSKKVILSEIKSHISAKIIPLYYTHLKGDVDMSINETMKINFEHDKEQEVREIIKDVYESLTIKGYDPISQIVGYIMSGDPTYITSHNGARSKIVKVERDEILEELVKAYIKTI